MRLNHVDLCASDVAALQGTLERHFGYEHAEPAATGLAPGRISGPFDVLGAHWTASSCLVGDGLEIEIDHRTPSPRLDRGRH